MMTRLTDRFVAAALGTIAALVPAWLAGSGGQAVAAEFPTKPIRMIVAFPPGGGTDAVARIIGPKMAERLAPVVVDNRGGASGIIGTEIAARATPDGYTIFLGTLGNLSVNPVLFKKLPFDIARDFDPVTQLVNVVFVLYVNPSLPAKSVSELIALAKSRPINYASSGNGGAPHLAAALFNSMAKINMTHVPYKGGGPAFTAILGGHVDVLFSNLTIGLAHLRSGRLRAIAVLTPKRSPLLPELPAVADSLPGYEILNWFGFVVPKGTPAPIVRRLHDEIVKALREPDVTERLNQLGTEPVGSSPREFGAFMKSESAKWARVIREAHITAN
jgi:tripartite-type tricarboxylate transporter receptor subunit TctC